MKMKKLSILACILSILILTCACGSEFSGSPSKEDALCSFLQSDRNMHVSSDDLNQYILSSNEYDGDTYYIMTDDSKELIYLVRVSEENGEFIAEKTSADISLTQSDPSESTVSLGNFGFTAGKIYDSSLKPYYHNEPVPVSDDGLFAVWFDNNNPKEDIVYNKN